MLDRTSALAAVGVPTVVPVGPFDDVSDPRNQILLAALSDHLVRTLGEHLTELATGQTFQWAACMVRDYLARGARTAQGAVNTISLGNWFFGKQPIEPSWDVASFARFIGDIPRPNLEVQCPVTRNLEWLTTALKLSDVEAKLLLCAYAMSHRESDRLRNVLMSVGFESEAKAITALSVLLDVHSDAIVQTFAPPNRLSAMRLFWKGRGKPHWSLIDFFETSDLFSAVLETVHRSPEAMLGRLLEPEPNWTLDPSVQTPTALYYEWFDKPLADALSSTVVGTPLTAEHIVATVEWLTGYRLVQAQCGLLAGHITFPAVEQVIKGCFVSNGLIGRPVSELMVLSALSCRRVRCK